MPDYRPESSAQRSLVWEKNIKPGLGQLSFQQMLKKKNVYHRKQDEGIEPYDYPNWEATESNRLRPREGRLAVQGHTASL